MQINVCVYLLVANENKKNASAGNRTRAARVAGEHSTTYEYMCSCHLLHRNSTVARRVTNATSEHYGDPQGYDGQDGTRGATYGLSGRCLLSWGSN